MDRPELVICRPEPVQWPRILEILEMANFHHIGGPEMPSFPLSDCFIALAGDRVIGVAGYRVLDGTTAKTTLLAVDPADRGTGAGAALHAARRAYLRSLGIRFLYTNTDDERVAAWYERVFGYRPTGKRIAKLAPFGRSDVHEWTNLVAELYWAPAFESNGVRPAGLFSLTRLWHKVRSSPASFLDEHDSHS